MKKVKSPPPVKTRTSTLPFTIHLRQLDFPHAPGVQSFVWGQADGKWLIIGGQDAGIHGFASSNPLANANQKLWVISPGDRKVWSAPLSAMPASMGDPLHSTNAQAARNGEILYVMGGYGYDIVTNSTVTFDTITTLHIKGLIDAIIHGRSITPYVARVHDPRAKVCGGKLVRIGKWFHLVFGQTFDGPFDPNDADIGKTFHWHYTEQVARFKMHGAFVWEYPKPIRDNTQHRPFHRRDFTAAPIVTPSGRSGLGVYGGVFMPGRMSVFRHPIYVDDRAGVHVDTSYSQFMNQYTCPALPMYSKRSKSMFTALFGGMSMYHYSARRQVLTLPKDGVPAIVPTISILGRNSKGQSAEYIYPVSLPRPMGVDAAFIPVENAPWFENGVLHLDRIKKSTLVGHIYGGIKVVRQKGGSTTAASNMIFEVRILPRPSQTRTPVV